MSYDIGFKVKVEGLDKYVKVGGYFRNISTDFEEMIVKSTGLDWKSGENIGLVKDVMPHIIWGYKELMQHSEDYREYEPLDGSGCAKDCGCFFKQIIIHWQYFREDSETEDLVDVATFWIE